MAVLHRGVSSCMTASSLPAKICYAVSDGVPFVVAFDGIDQPLEDVGDRAGDAAPIGDHRHPERVFQKRLGRDLHALQKDLDGHAFFVTVELEAVDGGIILITSDGFLRCLQVGGPQCFETASWNP